MTGWGLFLMLLGAWRVTGGVFWLIDYIEGR